MSTGPQFERDQVYADAVYADPVVPVVQQQPVAQPLVPQAVQPVVQSADLRGVAVRRSSVWRFDPAAVVAALFGIGLLLFGLIALVRAGTGGDWATPVVSVAGFAHTATLGAIEIGAGLMMLIAAFSGSRAFATFVATVIGVGAFVAAVQSDSFDQLAVESSFAWVVVVGALVVILAEALVPSIVDRRSAVYAR